MKTLNLAVLKNCLNGLLSRSIACLMLLSLVPSIVYAQTQTAAVAEAHSPGMGKLAKELLIDVRAKLAILRAGQISATSAVPPVVQLRIQRVSVLPDLSRTVFSGAGARLDTNPVIELRGARGVLSKFGFVLFGDHETPKSGERSYLIAVPIPDGSTPESVRITYQGQVLYQSANLNLKQQCNRNGRCEQDEDAFSCSDDCGSSSDGVCNALARGCDSDCTLNSQPYDLECFQPEAGQ